MSLWELETWFHYSLSTFMPLYHQDAFNRKSKNCASIDQFMWLSIGIVYVQFMWLSIGIVYV